MKLTKPRKPVICKENNIPTQGFCGKVPEDVERDEMRCEE